ncbi:unnamed protein product [Medioppia subpectinata]|uniref:Uncharacterized protein n=1 Tax=Medioppia subpectinata TaxID=1979941 RepID=A0A7R9KGT0_9ACAR|nr:unnamed protein product [Medioppia subpectinata]CAG2103126.1 unnamed protein product [Medioppia subpectinata]
METFRLIFQIKVQDREQDVNLVSYFLGFQNRRYKCKRQRVEKEEHISMNTMRSKEESIAMSQFPRRLSVPVLVRDGRSANKPPLHCSHYSHANNFGQNNPMHDFNYEFFW